MIKYIWSLLLIALVCSENAEVKSEMKENVPELKNATKVKIDSNPVILNNIVESVKIKTVDQNGDVGSVANPMKAEPYIARELDDQNISKYHYAILTICSLSVIAVIIFKTHR